MRKLAPVISLILVLAIVTAAFAQISYEKGVFTSYMVANLGPDPASVVVTYYDTNGTAQSYTKSLTLQPGEAQAIQQSLENSLAAGKYSAVISSSQPIAAIANQQLGVSGSGASYPPFSGYSGASSGSTSVTIPVIMYNWFGYYTELFIQNVGSAAATNVNIEFIPTAVGSCVTGQTGVTEAVATSGSSLALYASKTVSQFSKTALGNPGSASCPAYYNGRFLGSAKVTADQPISVIVNQVVQDKLFTYNGFTAAGTNIVVPAYLRNWFGYYASLTLANPGGADASVELVYTPGPGSNPSSVVTANRTVPAGKSITLYDGKTATALESDLIGAYPWNNAFSDTKQPNKFFGTVKITSSQPLVAMVNQEATTVAGNQAGSYNAMLTTEGTTKISAPFLASNYYGYYSSLTIMTVDGTEANLTITYTSDPTNSSVKSGTKAYQLSTTNGLLNRYEGPGASAAQSDILDDLFWSGADGKHRFLGSVVITSNKPIVAFVNVEAKKAATDPNRDTMYTYNAFNIQP